MSAPIWVWVLFNAVVLVVLAIDLGVTRARHRALSVGEAARWVLLWVSLSAFRAGCGGSAAGASGWVLHPTSSVRPASTTSSSSPVFEYFRIKPAQQHTLLVWGVLGAFVMRGTLILGGAVLVREFEWLLFLFGAFLLWTAYKLARSGDEPETDPGKNKVLALARRVLPLTEDAPEDRFVVRSPAGLRFTPMFLVLLVVETTDLMFALDSIPAVLGVSKDPFVLYTSNITAVLGLRSLFFVLSSLMAKLRYLKHALAVVLAFVGLKMIFEPWVPVPVWLSLSIIAGVLALAFLVSWLHSDAGDPPSARE
jgi:tellurite resistance protein TerC